MNPLLMQLMQRAGMGGAPQGGAISPPQNAGFGPPPAAPVAPPAPNPGSMMQPISGGVQPPGALPTPAPQPPPLGFGANPTGGGNMNPSMTGAEPTAQPSQASPPNAQFPRNPLGALLLPQTIQQNQQRFGMGGQPQAQHSVFGF